MHRAANNTKYRYVCMHAYISWWYDLSMMHFLPFFIHFIRILRRIVRYCCVCAVCTGEREDKFASWHAYIYEWVQCFPLSIDPFCWSQCMFLLHFFLQSTFFLCVFEKELKKTANHLPMCCAVYYAMSFSTVHSQLINLVKLYRWMYLFVDASAAAAAIAIVAVVLFIPCCPFFTHNTFLFCFDSSSHRKNACTHDLYKLNALLFYWMCTRVFTIYFLCIALIAFFSTFIDTSFVFLLLYFVCVYF